MRIRVQVRRPRAGLLGLALACIGAACSPGEGGAEYRSAITEELARESHASMIALLDEVEERTVAENPFHGTARLERLRRQHKALLATPDVAPLGRWRLHYELGQELLNHGRNEKALRHLNEAYGLLPVVDFGSASNSSRSPEQENVFYRNMTRMRLAVAYMRLAEDENCCQQYTGESCIVPIRGAGLHTRTEGARQAIRYFSEVLAERPAVPDAMETVLCEKTALWLLNVAHMTLGEYPEGVPPAFLVSLDAYESGADFPRFENVAPELGLDTFTLGGGAVVDDFDGDDRLDIMITSWEPSGQMRFYRNVGEGDFVEATAQAGLTGLRGGLNLVQADYDNDGDVDVFVTRGAWLAKVGRHPNSLIRNEGNGTFRDVTLAAGLGEVHYPSKTAAWADYDLDGDLDLFVGNEATNDMVASNQLFRNEGDATFSDVAGEAGVAEGLFSMGATWGDYDGDRYPDLYVTTGFSNPFNVLEKGGANRLYRNRGDGTFEDVTEALGVGDPVTAFPCWFWDFDNDGNLDIYASASSGPVAVLTDDYGAELNRLYRGDGRGGFREVSRELGLTFPAQPMGANFGDLDNDGYLDFYLGTGNIQFSELRPNVMFRNRAGQMFENVTLSGGFGHLQKGHGIAFADLDEDGDCDVYAQMGGAWPADKFNDALFENPGFGNHWLTVILEGRRSNRSAIGARIRVDITENGQSRTVYRHVTSGGSFGCNPLRQTVGLGQATAIEAVEVYWPKTDARQRFDDVALDQAVRIVEGEATLRPVPSRPVELGS